MWLDSKAVNCPQKWGNFSSSLGLDLYLWLVHAAGSSSGPAQDCGDLAVVLRQELDLLWSGSEAHGRISHAA